MSAVRVGQGNADLQAHRDDNDNDAAGWAEAQLRVKSYEGMSLDELAAEMKRELAELAASTSYRRAVSGTE